MACGLMTGAVLAVTTHAAPSEIKDPHYGEVLFNFYQQKFFSATTHLLAARQLRRVDHHADEAELLLGGMYLSYGLHQEAGRIFQALTNRDTSPEINDRAWFYLAKIRYQRNYLPDADAALARIHGILPGDLEPERIALSAQLHMLQQRYLEAVQVLENISSNSSWAAYGRYNLGVALIKVDKIDAGVRLLDKVGQMPAGNDEMRALRDKANLALGYYFLQQDEPVRAKEYLEQVRLSGMLSNMALLGIGWARSAQGEGLQSLVPWAELQDRNIMDAAVQESLLAVPYALGRLGAHKQSLEHYEKAIALYNKEIDRLTSSIQAIGSGQLVKSLLQQNPEDEMGWFWRSQDLPDAPESHYLLRLMAGHDFQESLKNFRDLNFLSRNLENWSENAHIYEDMLATRRRAFTERLPKVVHATEISNLEKLKIARDRYAAELTQAESDEDALALASDAQKRQWERLQNVERNLGNVTAGPATLVAKDKLRLLRGLLRWDMAAEYKSRLRETKMRLKELEQAISEASARRDTMQRAQVDAPKEFETFARRIRVVRERIAQRRTEVASVAHEQQMYIQDIAIAELEKQRQRLTEYLTQAQFAVSQIHDQSLIPNVEPK